MKNIDLFNTAGKNIEFPKLLREIQEYMPNAYSNVMANDDTTKNSFEIKSRIIKYLKDFKYCVDGFTLDELVNKLYNEMAEFSFLTPYLNFTIKDVEGIEIDSWDSVKIKYIGGIWKRSKEHFLSPQHAYDIMKRLLGKSGITMDDAKPLARGHLDEKIRITVIGGGGILDKNVGVAASIRFVNPSDLTAANIIKFGTLTPEMLDFLCTSYRYGISMMLAGETDAGKTTLMSIIMSNAVPPEKKLITIEYGTREFNLTRRDEYDNIVNSVVHLVTKESTNPDSSITQQMELEHAMTMNPDYLCMAEVKGSEAFETIEAALTGHPVIGTTHTGCCRDIPDRLVQLASYKGSNLKDDTLYKLTIKAFPILFYAQKCEDGVRRVTEICECRIENGKSLFKTLWEYRTAENKIIDGKTIVNGYFKKVGTISESLQAKLRRKGIPEKKLQEFLNIGGGKSEAHRINSIPNHGSRDTNSSKTLAI